MADSDQERPLAPARIDEESLKSKHRRRRIKLCGCVTVTILLLVMVILILAFTVFKVQEPKVTTNGIKLTNLNLALDRTPMPQVKLNMSMLIDMSIKNPNAASFKLGNTTTTIYYRGEAVAEARTLPGLIKARRTLGMNVTVDILADRLASSPNLVADVIGGKLIMETYSVISGRVKILFVKKHVDVRMNCTVTIDISSKAIYQDMSCKRKVKL